MKEFFENHKKVVLIIGIGLVVLIYLISGVINTHKEKERQEESDRITEELLAQANSGSDDTDSLLMQMQPELVKTYGEVPDGFIWETDGTVLSLGDKNMTAEEVVYAYFRGLTSLDISTVERYSRDSVVVNTYSGYFNEQNKNTDYTDQFIRNIYRECLLSFQIEGIESESVFAENKKVYTVNAKMLDLTAKDFWKEDAEEIYYNLYLYDSEESDTTKSDMYLYDYILQYYKSGLAGLRDVTFDITVQRYPDLDSGWLVSVDTDVDDACQYRDGKLVVSYIRDMYRDVGRDFVLANKDSLGSTTKEGDE